MELMGPSKQIICRPITETHFVEFCRHKPELVVKSSRVNYAQQTSQTKDKFTFILNFYCSSALLERLGLKETLFEKLGGIWECFILRPHSCTI